MEAAKLRGDLTQCWLAEALVQVLERAETQCLVSSHALISLGDATVAEQGAVLSELLNSFLRRDEVLAGHSGVCRSRCDHGYMHAADMAELQRWASDVSSAKAALLLVVYIPCEEEEASVKQVENIVEMVANLQRKILLLVLHNPAGLLGMEASSREMATSTMYHVEQFAAAKTVNQTASDGRRGLKFIAQPLDCLRDQCGWHFVMEIIRWIPESAGAVSNTKYTFGAARATMFSTINKLPFQLLLLVLRWSHFHPELLRACSKKLKRQTRLIPQARVRRELADLQHHEVQIWSHLYPSANMMNGNAENVTAFEKERTASRLFLDTSSQPEVSLTNLVRLSKCCLWDTQKKFYKDQGIRAWSSGDVPFGVSSSSFLAAGYARIAVDFLLSTADCVRPSFRENGVPNCFVWEAASGSCKFLHSFMLHFLELVDVDDEFKRRGLMPLVVATDLSEQVLSSRRQMACFRPFIERGQLDFALFDTHDFVFGNPSVSGRRKTLELVHSKRLWQVGRDGPVALMGNYFLDSLRADIFTVAIQREISPTDTSSDEDGCNDKVDERVVVQSAVLDKDTPSIADMNISLQPIGDPRTQTIYEDERLNAIFVQVVDQFRARSGTSISSADEPVSLTGLVIFPVEAFEFILTLVDRDDEAQAYPVAFLAGDARFSFRDVISNAFITTSATGGGTIEQVSLVLPQLSPHPDCFCLPVDFEVFELFFEHLNSSTTGISANSELVSAPASDTFDVFFATIEPRGQKSATARVNVSPTANSKALHTSFKHQFARFTPGDCDLLWGMMSFDDGARCFSVDALLALLAQTGWDFDLFEVLYWELLNRLRRQEVGAESAHYQIILVEAGMKSWRTFYHMEQRTETDVTTRGMRLQLARWFYVLEAYNSVLEVLVPWLDEARVGISLDDVGVFYLLGLTSLRMDEYWTALSFFRLCARLAPTKLKFQRQVARTLVTLQTLRSASNSSNESDGGSES